MFNIFSLEVIKGLERHAMTRGPATAAAAIARTRTMPNHIFHEYSYERETFNDVEFSNDGLKDVVFYHCTFSSASFQYTELADCFFEKCVFESSNLSLVSLSNSKFVDVTFQDSKLLGINWSGTSGIFSANYKGCILDNNAFVGMALNNMQFDGCSLKDASFIQCKLKKASFKDCDMENCQFNQTDLSYADFRSARNYYINATNNKLHKTAFSLPEAVSLLGNFDIVLK